MILIISRATWDLKDMNLKHPGRFILLPHLYFFSRPRIGRKCIFKIGRSQITFSKTDNFPAFFLQCFNRWNILRETQNPKYEKALTSAPDPNDWFHVKIVVDYPHVMVYVNNSASPCLSVDKLNDRQTGKIGLWVGNSSGGDFANLVITNK